MKNFLKPFIWVISWLLLLSWVFAMVQWNNSKLELSQKSMVFTDDGTVWWDMVAWINTGWDSIFYWPLLDGEWNLFLTGYTETDPVFTANSGDYYPLAGNSISNPITGALFMWDATTSYNMEIGTTIVKMWWYDIPVSTPIITPMSTIPWFWVLPILITKGWNFFIWETWADTQIFLSSADTNFITSFNQRDDKAKFSITLSSWDVANWITSWNFDKDWTIQASQDITPYIDDNKDFITKGYFDANSSTSTSIYSADWTIADANRTIDGNGSNLFFNNLARFDLATFSDGITLSTVADILLQTNHSKLTLKNDWVSTLETKYDLFVESDSILKLVWSGWILTRGGYFSILDWMTFCDSNGCSYATDYSGLNLTNPRWLVDKWYVDERYIPRTSVDTGFNHTGSDTIIPSEKTVWSLVSWLNNDYIPFWDGSKFINSSIHKTTDFLRLSFVSTWTFLSIYNDFMFASTNFVDWKITQDRFKIWTPDWLTTGVYIEWKMLDWVIDVYANTGVNLNTTDVVITGNIYADWSSVKFNTESFVWWFNSSAGGLKSASIWHNCKADGDFSIAIWSYSQAIWNSSISMWNQVKTYAHSSTALWRHTEARSEYWVVMGRYNVGNTDSLLEIWDGSTTTWYNEFEFKKDGRFIISDEWSFIVNASWNLDIQYLSGSSWETADTFTKS